MIKYLLICLLAIVTNGTVLGIDFGSEFIKAVLISPGKSFTIIENTTSKRKTENAIAFYNKERLYESDGVSKKSKSPKNTFTFLNKFLGALANDEKLVEISRQSYEDFKIEIEEREGTFAFEVDGVQVEGKDTMIVKVEELAGMVLKFIAKLVDFNHQIQIKDVVLTVPSEWNISQRSALKSAAQLAELEVLGIINENTAAALYYALERSDENKHTALFYNIGSYNIQVSLVEFQAVDAQKKKVETLRVLADYSIPNAGGQSLDLLLANHFAREFDNQPSRKGKKSIFTNSKAMNKLLKAANKYKEILSANKETQVYLEGLIDGEDYTTSIQRSTFESLFENKLQQLTEPINYVLEKCNKTKEDINIVELIGGGIRVPKIQQELANYFGSVEVGTHLNGDESMAFGAAFHAANLSHSFKVRPVQLTDGFSFSSSIEINGVNDDDYHKEFSLFGYKKKYGSTRSLEFTYDKNLRLDIYVEKDGQKSKLMSYHLTNITNATELNFSKPEISLTFKSTSNEFIKLESAEMKVEEIKLIEIKPNVTTTNTTSSQDKDKPTNKTETNDNENTEEGDLSEETEKQQDEHQQSEEQPKVTEQVVQEPQFKKQKFIHTFPINYTITHHVVLGLNQQEIDDSKKIIKQFETAEENSRKLSEIKNKLESLIYTVREVKDAEYFQKASTETERAEILKTIEEHSEYLDSDEAWTADFEKFNTKFTQLNNLLKPIQVRLDEAKARPQFINETITKLTDFHKKANNLNQTMPWVPEEKKVKFLGHLANTTDWLKSKLEEQEKRELHQDPAFLIEELKKKIDKVSEEYTKIKAITKPRKTQEQKEEEKKKKEEKKQTKKDAESDSKKGSKQQEQSQQDEKEEQQNQQQQQDENFQDQQDSQTQGDGDPTIEDL
ncbi:unnamed protein product (macronuclear) [Paramecium tetraurelia]|uniref:Uncharacterized protein n=1 Tax=Paramecium tetraurelia TaxID=5888 RepID=A0CRJ3_PARTE|nr:uncharacterized protein GSPATT00009725001 [Paramecium tetraurelia]CAK73410.1 unnamed protein product [Paramecium tetraurelia]|eukprot:XP_001440807.1 hypothetical protein (macronuclear) [Paramecium tetraurelia strain d4-2]